MKKLSIRKDVLLVGICNLMVDHIKRREQFWAYEHLNHLGDVYKSVDKEAEAELAQQLEAIRNCKRNRFDLLVPTYEIQENENV